MTVKKYSKDSLTVNWQPEKCIHSAICANGLKEVFDPQARPWINMEGASIERIAQQVKKCPSGALSIDEEKTKPNEELVKIDVTPNGPLLIQGDIMVIKDGEIEIKNDTRTALCRCGASKNKPYCDGAHKNIGFQG